MNYAGIAADLFRTEALRIIAARLGTHHLQLADDADQDALVRELQSWPYRGIPESPAASLTQTARNVRSTNSAANKFGTRSNRASLRESDR